MEEKTVAVVALVTIMLSVLPSVVNDVTFDPAVTVRIPSLWGSEVANTHL